MMAGQNIVCFANDWDVDPTEHAPGHEYPGPLEPRALGAPMNLKSCDAKYLRLKQSIVPNLTFNQTLFENILRSHVSQKTIWLEAGGGHKLLPSCRGDPERELVQGAEFVCGCDGDEKAIREYRSLKHRVP